MHCKKGGYFPPRETNPDSLYVQCDFWDRDPQEFSDVSEDILLMRQTVDRGLRGQKGNVIFCCKAGKHRSYAAAVSYLLWAVRSSTVNGIDAWATQLHQRFELNAKVIKVKGKARRALRLDLIRFEEYLVERTPKPLFLAL